MSLASTLVDWLDADTTLIASDGAEDADFGDGGEEADDEPF